MPTLVTKSASQVMKDHARSDSAGESTKIIHEKSVKRVATTVRGTVDEKRSDTEANALDVMSFEGTEDAKQDQNLVEKISIASDVVSNHGKVPSTPLDIDAKSKNNGSNGGMAVLNSAEKKTVDVGDGEITHVLGMDEKFSVASDFAKDRSEHSETKKGTTKKKINQVINGGDCEVKQKLNMSERDGAVSAHSSRSTLCTIPASTPPDYDAKQPGNIDCANRVVADASGKIFLLHKGFTALGKRWLEISVKYFNSTRFNEYLRNRWPRTKEKMERADFKIDSSRTFESIEIESEVSPTEHPMTKRTHVQSNNNGANETRTALNSTKKQNGTKIDSTNDNTKSGSAVDVYDREVTHVLSLDEKVSVKSDALGDSSVVNESSTQTDHNANIVTPEKTDFKKTPVCHINASAFESKAISTTAANNATNKKDDRTLVQVRNSPKKQGAIASKKELKPLFEVDDLVYAPWWPDGEQRKEKPSWYSGKITRFTTSTARSKYGPTRFYSVIFDDDNDHLTDIPEEFVFSLEDYELIQRNEGNEWIGVRNVTDEGSSDLWAKIVGWYETDIDGETFKFSRLSEALRAYDAHVLNNNGTDEHFGVANDSSGVGKSLSVNVDAPVNKSSILAMDRIKVKAKKALETKKRKLNSVETNVVQLKQPYGLSTNDGLQLGSGNKNKRSNNDAGCTKARNSKNQIACPVRRCSNNTKVRASRNACCHVRDAVVRRKSRGEVKNCVRTRTNWTEDEDRIVIKAMSNFAKGEAIKWERLREFLPGRKCSHIRNRWNLSLKPGLIHTPFTHEEDLLLYKGFTALGKRWLEISVKYFNSTRSNEYLRNRWPRTKEKMERADFKIDSSELKSEDFDAKPTASTESPAEDIWGTSTKKRVRRRESEELNKVEIEERYKFARKNPRCTATKLSKNYIKECNNVCYDYGNVERATTKKNSRYVPTKTMPDLHGDVSLGQLNKDTLHYIASFLPSLSALASFCSVSKETNILLKHSNRSELLLRGLFLKKFKSSCQLFKHLTWRDQWIRMINFRRGFERIGSPSEIACTVLPTSLGLLPTHIEQSAILYDNPMYGAEDSHGYSGMQILHNLPHPPNAQEWEAPLIIHGDFNGVRICRSVDDLINHSGSINQDCFVPLGHDEDGGEVLSLMLSPSDLLTLDSNVEDVSPPCCFVGFASGRVAAIHATLTDDKTQYNFTMAEYHAHSFEVTCLAVVNFKSSDGNPFPVLFSACCGGDVSYYPHAMSKENGYSMQAVPAFSNLNNCPIFSMTSTQTQVGTVGDESCNILVIGDQSGNISLWSIHNDAIFGCGPAPKDSFSRVGVVKGGQGKHSITTTKIIQKNILVSGNTNGDIRFWDIESVQKPRLSLRQDHCGAHSGSVEACMSVGDVLLTSGGNDGKLVGWDISTCNEIGGLSCHPGRKTLVRDTRSRRTMKCCVIGFILPAKREGRLVTLCRDGVLAYWAFDVP